MTKQTQYNAAEPTQVFSAGVTKLLKKVGPHDQAQLLLLLTMADHIGEDGKCWPGYERLCLLSHCSERKARRKLSVLRDGDPDALNPDEQPWITAQQTRRQNQIYTMNLSKLAALAEACPFRLDGQEMAIVRRFRPAKSDVEMADQDHSRPAINNEEMADREIKTGQIDTQDRPKEALKPAKTTPVSNKNRINRKNQKPTVLAFETKTEKTKTANAPRRGKRHSYDPAFQQVYELYPSAEEKAEAAKEWPKAVRRLQEGEPDLDPMTVDDAVEFLRVAAVDYSKRMADREPRFIRSMRRWLNNRTYLDFKPPQKMVYEPITFDEAFPDLMPTGTEGGR